MEETRTQILMLQQSARLVCCQSQTLWLRRVVVTGVNEDEGRTEL